jgi:CheY-like chemotaxis protein
MFKILLIDEKQVSYSDLSVLAKDIYPGCEVFQALTGAEGLEIIEEAAPDIIFVDSEAGHNPSDTDGLEVCRKLKSNVAAQNIPLVMIAPPCIDEEIRKKSMDIGVDSFLSSPLDEIEVKELVRLYTRMKEDNAGLIESETRLRQSQRTEAIGKLAGGIAHNFNNLLTVILGYSDILVMKSKKDKHLQKYIDQIKEIKKSAEKASAITQQLLSFSRKQVLQLKRLNLNKLIFGIENLFVNLLGDDMIIKTDLEPELGLIQADPDQMEQIIMNLIVFTRDTIEDTGELGLRTQNLYIDPDKGGEESDLQPGYYVLLTVDGGWHGAMSQSEDQNGMPYEATTREQSRSDNKMGIPTVSGMVKQNNGYLKAYGGAGQGLMFEVYLPRIDEVYERQEESGNEKELECGDEVILLVDDEDVVRNTVYAILSDSGYFVLQARNVEEALFISESQQDKPIKLLVTDIVMPGMTGYQLAEKILTQNPDMKVLYMSGYPNDTVVQQGMMARGVPFIQKPFTPNSLAHKVREVLDKA